MAYKHVSPELLRPYVNDLYRKGLRGEALAQASEAVAQDLEYKLAQSKDTRPLFVKSLGVGTTDTLSNVLRGLGYIPGLKKPLTYMADALQEEGAFGLKGTTDPHTRRSVSEAMDQPILSGDYISAGLGHLAPGVITTLLAAQAGPAAPYILAGFFGAQGVGRTDKMLREMGVSEEKIAPRALAMGGVEAITSRLFFKNIASGWSPSKTVLGSMKNIVKAGSKNFAKDIIMMGGTAALESEVQDKLTTNVLDAMSREDPGWQPNFEYHKPSTMKALGGSLVLGSISKVALGLGHRIIKNPSQRTQILEASKRMADEIETAINTPTWSDKKGNKVSAPNIYVARQKLNTAFVKRVSSSTPFETVVGGLSERMPTGVTAPAGTWSIQKAMRSGMTVREMTERVNSLTRDGLVKLATGMKVGSATDPSDILRQRVIDNFSGLKEGLRTVWVDRKGNKVEAPDVYTARQKLKSTTVRRDFVEETPTVNPAAQSTKTIISNVNKLILKYLGDKVKAGMPETDAVGAFAEMQMLALRRAGLSVDNAKAYLKRFQKKGDAPILGDYTKLGGVGEFMTQQQASKYLYMLNGAYRRKINLSKMTRLAKHQTMNEIDRAMFKDVPAPPFNVVWENKAQQWVDTISKEYPRIGMVASWVRPLFMQLTKLQNKIPALPFLRVDSITMERTKKGQMIQQYLTSYMHESYNKIPEIIKRGIGGQALQDLVYFMMTTGQIKSRLTRQYKVRGNTNKAFAQRVIEIAKVQGKYTPEQVVSYAKTVADRYAKLFRWLGEANGIEPQRMLEHYAPIFYEFSQKASATMSFSEYIEANKKALKAQGLDDVDFEHLKDLDSIYYANKYGQKDYTHTPGFLLARKMDDEMFGQIGEAVMNTKIDKALERYIRGTIRRLLFNDTVPIIEGLYQHTDNILRNHQIDPTPVKKLYDNYLTSMFNIESPSDKMLRTANIRTDLGVASKLIDSFSNMWNDKLGHVTKLRLFGKDLYFGGHYIPEHVSVSEAIRNATDATFAWFLGLPFGWKAPIKNIATQNVMAGVTGMGDYIRGVMKALDPKNIERYNKQKLRMDMHNMLDLKETEGLRGATGQLLSLFAASDMWNVYTSAGVADVLWDRVEEMRKNNPRLKGVRMEDFNNLLALGKRVKEVGLNEKEVATRNPDFYSIYKFGKSPKPFRGLSVEMYDAIQNGRPEMARNMLSQFMVNISQWRYSHGGNPAFLNMKAFKPFFIFGSWALNNLEYTFMFGPGSGMLRKQAQVWASQILVAGILAKLGLNTHRWILGGNVPEVELVGPVVDEINEMIRLFKAGSEAGLATVLPIKEEERKRSVSRFKNMTKKTTAYNLYDAVNDMVGE